MARRRYAPCVVRGANRSSYTKAELQKSYNRGIGAYDQNYTGPRSSSGAKLISAVGWACGRVNALIRGKSDVDPDIRRARNRRLARSRK